MKINKVNRTILIFGIYTFLMGMVLLFISDRILPLLNLPVSEEPWINLLGFVLSCSSYYYIRSALSGNVQFALYTTHTRFVAPIVVGYLIVTGKADLNFAPFGILDGLGGLWTWIEIKRNQQR